MKLWYQNVYTTQNLDDFKPLEELLQKNFAKAKRSDTEIVISHPSPALTTFEQFQSWWGQFLNNIGIYKGIEQAANEGFDAAMAGCYYDPALREAREVLDIPVVGPGESSMVMSCIMGGKFGIVTVSDKAISFVEEQIDRYGMRSRAISRLPVRTHPMPPNEQAYAAGDASLQKKFVEQFKEVAEGLVTDGADIVIMACTVGSPIINVSGLRDVDGAMFLDCDIAMLKFAEILADLRSLGSNWISRKRLYKSLVPPKELLKQVWELFPSYK